MQIIVVAVLFALLGVVLGLMSPLTIPITYARYTAVALLAALDSIFGAFKAYISGTFEPRVFFSGLLTNMTLAAGLTTKAAPGLGVYAADLTGDGWPDIFVANDAKPNHLWVNQRNGTFTEEAVSRGLAYTAMGQAYAGMGIAVGDADNDGMLDLYVTHLTVETNTLWVQGPRGLFRDRTMEAGLAGTRWRATGFGTVLADFDHDGWADLAVVNGRVSRADRVADGSDRLGFWAPYAERNQLLANDGTGKFSNATEASGLVE